MNLRTQRHKLFFFDVNCGGSNPIFLMQRIENLSYPELVDLLAEKTSRYTTVLRDQRNTLEHTLLKEEIQELVKLIELKRNMDQIVVNPGTSDSGDSL